MTIDEPRSNDPAPAFESTRVLRVFYFCAFISVGISTPNLSPYLRDRGLSGQQIATVMSLVPLCNLGVPLLWGWIADRTHRHERVLRVACLGGAIAIFLLGFAQRFESLLTAYGLFAAFNVGVTPVADTLAVAGSPDGRGYGRVRVWGSIGFLAAAVTGGALLTWRRSVGGYPLVPLLMGGGLVAATVVAFRIRAPATRPLARPHFAELRALLRDRRFRLLLVVGMVHWMALAPYNAFFGLFLRGRHLPPSVGGAAFATGVVAEGLVLYGFTALRRHFKLETLLAISFGATAVRWILTWSTWSPGPLIALQAVHGLTFGLFWITGMALLNEIVPKALRATGQAVYLMAILGAGSLTGYHATGLALDLWRDVGRALLVAGLVEIVPLVLILRAGSRRAPARGP
ncbi:MAG TPA: MFS transporter [Polyangia bacterium]